MRRIAGTLGLMGGMLGLMVPGAQGAVTVGMVAPTTPSAICSGANDVIQEAPAVDYEIPQGIASPVITSWSTNAAPGAGQQLALKVWEFVEEPATYRQVAHDGPRALTGGTLNTFESELPVRAGLFLGLGTPSGSADTGCTFSTAIGSRTSIDRYFNDGESGQFAAQIGLVNVSAVIEASNRFTIGSIERNRRKGTARVSVTVPGPGSLALSGKGVRAQQASPSDPPASKTVSGAGMVKLLVRAKGRKRQRLTRTGRVKVKFSITYTPTGGSAATQVRKLKLRKA